MRAPWLRVLEGAVEVDVRVVPRSSRDRVAGVAAERLRVQVTSPPVEGEANRRVLEVLARSAGLAPSAATLVSGAKSRSKKVRLCCNSPHQVADKLEAAAADAAR